MPVDKAQAQMLTRHFGDDPIDHELCADCVRCTTCRREWCPTIMDHCPGDQPWRMHPTGGSGTRDDEYCYRCTNCSGGYFQFHREDSPPCVVVEQPPHTIAEGKGTQWP